MSYYIRDGVDLKEVPLHKVETLMNAGITIISDKDIIKELKQQLEALEKENRGLKMMLNHVAGVEHVCEDLEVKLAEALEVIEFYGDKDTYEYITSKSLIMNIKENCIGEDVGNKARQFLAKYRREK